MKGLVSAAAAAALSPVYKVPSGQLVTLSVSVCLCVCLCDLDTFVAWTSFLGHASLFFFLGTKKPKGDRPSAQSSLYCCNNDSYSVLFSLS